MTLLHAKTVDSLTNSYNIKYNLLIQSSPHIIFLLYKITQLPPTGLMGTYLINNTSSNILWGVICVKIIKSNMPTQPKTRRNIS